MHNSDEKLASLWQNQSVEQLDILKIQREFLKQQWKQRLYIAVDVLSPLPFILMLIFMKDELSNFSFWTCVVAIVVSVPYIGYFTWLRRHAAFPKGDSTTQHIDLLQRQLANNVKIARYTKHLSWISALVLVTVNVGRLLNGDFDSNPSFSLSVFWWWMATGCGVCLAFYIWAGKREKRFVARQHELAHVTHE
ncbi:hypothetical protein [Aestuariibacter sp. A3R04]|uniref:hypothetical protein n=1 Tax=Aestuariibacter sp. A3R04 TaxID=2841571 RepID=UPI001C09DB67|nr:hypothetical protein [Aestuariibacter sp. A3R04]MBU3020287.1 hypothetical protein [Aestuariibacter sp. A3R04]